MCLLSKDDRHAPCGATPEGPRGRAATLLVVEADGLRRSLLRGLLSEAGHLVISCEHAYEALDLLSWGLCPDLMVVDEALPRMDGVALVAEVRGHAHLCHTPILVRTGSPGAAARALAAGADAALRRSRPPERLLAAVAALLGTGSRASGAGDGCDPRRDNQTAR